MEEQSHKNSRLSSISEGASYEKVPDTDDTILKEFKIKYQKSLEAIQSLQEILELKKTYGSISHTYDAVRLLSQFFTHFFFHSSSTGFNLLVQRTCI